jgi:hypothetical protein
MKDLNTTLLRFHQREQLQAEIDQADKMIPHAKPEEKGGILASRDRTKRQLDAQSPDTLTGKEKDTLHALEKKLRTRITTNMPPEEVMRKNPAGAVDWHMKWEKANKKLIRMWKNVRIQLNPENSDRDLANIERYRPSGQMDRMRSDAQIPGVMSYHDIPDEQWPFEAPQNTAVEQAKRVYNEEQAESEVNSAIDALDAEEQREPDIEAERCSPEQKAQLLTRLAKGREVLRQKREAAKQLDESLDAVPDVLNV